MLSPICNSLLKSGTEIPQQKWHSRAKCNQVNTYGTRELIITYLTWLTLSFHFNKYTWVEQKYDIRLTDYFGTAVQLVALFIQPAWPHFLSPVTTCPGQKLNPSPGNHKNLLGKV